MKKTEGKIKKDAETSGGREKENKMETKRNGADRNDA